MKLRWLLFTVLCSLFTVLLFPKAAFGSCRVESSCSAGGVQADFTLSKPEAASACPNEAEAGNYSICCYDDTKQEQEQYGRYFSARELASSQDALKAAACGTATETIPGCASCFNGGLLVCYGRDRATGETDPELQCQPGEDYCGVEIKDEDGDGKFMYNGKPYGVQAVSVCGSNNFACTQPNCTPLFDYPQPGSAGKSGSGVKPTDSYDADTLCYERELINEPHPLRPAPGLVCNKEVPSPWNLSCANDVLPTLTVQLDRTKKDAYNCSDAGDIGRERCTRKIKEYQPPPVTVTIDLGNLELPIAGVASNTRVSDTLTDGQKLLNYTSWYLQGAVEQSEQEPLDYFSSSDLHRLLAYAGPLKKLIPKDVLNENRKQLISAAVNKTTYNQIIGYVKDNQVIGRKQAQQNLAGVTIIRLTDMKDHLNPPWDDHDPEKQKWYTLWQQVPFTGKEDPGRNPNASGHVDVPGEVFPTACIRSQEDPRRCQSDPTVLDARFTVTSGVDSFRVNFPHLVEDDTLLMSMLQNALISPDVDRTAVRPNYPLLEQNLDQATRLPEWTQNSQGNYPNADGCRQTNALWNPGDNLEARRNQTGGRITGRLSFKKDIEYSFDVDTPASFRYIEICQNSGRTDCPRPLPPTVPAEITAPVPVHIRYSHMDEIADRTVVGPGSIFKALYPDIPHTIGELINRPAESAIGYSCAVPGGRCQADSTSHKGQPRAFFPFWGTILDLFHTKIQHMLNPLISGLAIPGQDTAVWGTDYLTANYPANLLRQLIVPSAENIAALLDKIKLWQTRPGNTWIGSKFDQNYQKIIDFGLANNLNPTLLLALYLEESHGEAFGDFPMGCGGARTLDASLDCLARDPVIDTYRAAPLWEFMCRYADGHYPCDYAHHPNFIENLFNFYNQLAP